MAKEKNIVTLDDVRCSLYHTPTGETYDFVAASGVYFIKVKVPNTYMGSNAESGFSRHGATA